MRKFESSEEVVVSALLGPFLSEEDSVEKYSEYTREVLMKLVLALLSTEAPHSDGDLSACIKTKSFSLFTQTVQEKLDELLQYLPLLALMAVDAVLFVVVDPVKLYLVNGGLFTGGWAKRGL
ncbi:hypothetical protein COP1_022684 [Malus domestica]